MFTGIVERMGRVLGTSGCKGILSLQVGIPRPGARVRRGSSIAINGVCLTVVRKNGKEVYFDVVGETVRRTNLGILKPDDPVNIEFSLTPASEIAGHWVTGHVDGTGMVLKREKKGGDEKVWIKLKNDLARMLVPKGSVAVDGVSLTVVNVRRDRFSVALIPYTLRHTILGRKRAGDAVNIELDMIGKYVRQYISARGRSGR